MKRKADRQAKTARLLGKSCGFSISEMKVGNRICGTQRNVMLSTAFIAATNVVPAGGKAYVFTSPASGKSPRYPVPGASSMPAKTRKSKMAMPMQAAENMDMNDTCLNVRGRDMTMPISVTMTENETVQSEWSDSVLRTLAPVKT
jgi:hypothetical protein